MIVYLQIKFIMFLFNFKYKPYNAKIMQKSDSYGHKYLEIRFPYTTIHLICSPFPSLIFQNFKFILSNQFTICTCNYFTFIIIVISCSNIQKNHRTS